MAGGCVAGSWVSPIETNGREMQRSFHPLTGNDTKPFPMPDWEKAPGIAPASRDAAFQVSPHGGLSPRLRKPRYALGGGTPPRVIPGAVVARFPEFYGRFIVSLGLRRRSVGFCAFRGSGGTHLHHFRPTFLSRRPVWARALIGRHFSRRAFDLAGREGGADGWGGAGCAHATPTYLPRGCRRLSAPVTR